MESYGKISFKDIHSRKFYESIRDSLRKEIVKRKKNRRIYIGPYVTLYFENRATILHQINEMVFIENAKKEQIEDEIGAYKTLVPNGKELVITLMVEIDNPIKRSEILLKLGGIEGKVEIKVNDLVIKGKPEKDVERTTEDGKASSVQFIHIPFTGQMVNKFKNIDNNIIIGINHKNYNHYSSINPETRRELLGDFA